MAARTDSAALRRRVRLELREARDRNGLTQVQVAQAMRWSESKVIRIEAGINGISANDLRALLDYYKITNSGLVDEMVELATESRRSDWARFRDVCSRAFRDYLSCENAAAAIDEHETLLVPGLLQIEAYARAVQTEVFGNASETAIERRWQVRARRQQLHDRDEPPRMTFLLDENVLRRGIGGPAVMRAQLSQLARCASWPHVTLRVVPFGHGGHPGLGAPSFTLLGFADPAEPGLLYLEQPHDSTVTRDDRAAIESYESTFAAIGRAALPEAESLQLIRSLSAELEPQARDAG